ncbi:MAG: hypothetical protein E6J20_13575 [Chloroflexi bacterium]|nr:MAG: hypothetical protein E6J20_13575 [Chloroflexota bacterium]
MRQLRRIGLAFGAALLVFLPQTAGATQPLRFPSGAFVGTFAAGQVCSFAVDTAPVGATQTETLYFDRSGNVIKIGFTGVSYISLTNDTTKKTIVVNASGTGALYPQGDGSFLGSGGGPGLFALFPTDSGGPALLQIRGRETFTISPSGQIQNLVVVGTVTDLCAVLGS